MKKNIFEYHDYKKYLDQYITNQPKKGYGFRSKMADAANCKVSFISQVLNKNAQLSLEQGEALNNFLGHTQKESDYFILLIQYNRAGSNTLKQRFKNQLDKIIEHHHVLKNRFDIKETLSIEDQAEYYSHWYYAYITILLTINSDHTRESIAEACGLPLSIIAKALDFLVSVGMAKIDGGQYIPTKSRLFLGNDSPNITKHHLNWRLQAMKSLDKDLQTDLHFSGVVSLATSDIALTKEELIKGLEAARTVVRKSRKEEEIFGICIDFFKI